MQTHQLRSMLPAAMLVVGLGLSAGAFAATSTGGYVDLHPTTNPVAADVSSVGSQVAQTSAHNPVLDEGDRPNTTWVNNTAAYSQLESGVGAQNFVNRDSDRSDTMTADHAADVR